MALWGSGRRGAARISLYLLFRCYIVTKSFKAPIGKAFRCNCIRNEALVASLQTHRPRHLLRDLRSLSRKKPQKHQHRISSVTEPVTQSVTNSVTAVLSRHTETRSVTEPITNAGSMSEGLRPPHTSGKNRRNNQSIGKTRTATADSKAPMSVCSLRQA